MNKIIELDIFDKLTSWSFGWFTLFIVELHHASQLKRGKGTRIDIPGNKIKII